MKRKLKTRGLSCFLAWSMVMGLSLPSNVVGQTRFVGVDNPFLSMYDSDAVFLEEVGKVIEVELIKKYQGVRDKSDMMLFPDILTSPEQKQKSIGSPVLISEEGLSYFSEQILTAVKEDNLEEFQALELEEQRQDWIETLYEDSRVDSYIIKYKESGNKMQLVNKIQIADVVETAIIELPSTDLKIPSEDEFSILKRIEELEKKKLESLVKEDLIKEESVSRADSELLGDNVLQDTEAAMEDNGGSFNIVDMPESEGIMPTDKDSDNDNNLTATDLDNNESITKENGTQVNYQNNGETGLLERIVLSEKVNPAEFAMQLQAAGLAEDIEYIQPDFLFSYASLELVVNEVGTGEGTETGTATETPGVEDEDNIDTGAETEEGTEDDNEASNDEDIDEPDEILEEDELSEAERLEQERIEAERLEQERLEQERLEEELRKLLEQQQLSQNVIVALIDTGVDVNHPALQGNLLPGWNFVADSDNVYDTKNPMQAAHGTHIAGIIAQNSISEQVKIMPLQVFGTNGAYTSDIIAAIHCAEQNGAQIVNMSFGSGSYNFALEETMRESGMLFVSAAGNGRSDLVQTPVYPAAFTLDNMISVASLNADKGLSYYSNYNTTLIDIAAIGRDVESSLPEDRYGLQSGTSMAAGFVSAAAGSVLTQVPDLQAEQLKQRLINTADMYEHLENKVAGGRSLNQINALMNYIQTETTSRNCEEDFDVHGYQPTSEESWELFSTKIMIDVSAGNFLSVSLADDGTVWEWGRNNGTTKYSAIPIQVIGLSDIVAISVATSHNLALKSDGTVWAWGSNNYGQLGNGSTTTNYTPVQVSGLSNITYISAGDNHSTALKEDGTVWTWGNNSSGELGNGSTANRSTTPVQVSDLVNVSGISAGSSHNIAIKEDGTVWAWGKNNAGQLGDGTNTKRTTPVKASVLSNVTDVSAGGSHSMAIKEDGTVWAWGSNFYGQLGEGSNTSYSAAPVKVNNLSGISGIFAGGTFSMAMKNDGTVWTWGNNNCGQLGDNSDVNSNIPVQASGLSDITIIAAGLDHSLALTTENVLWAWGSNLYGQLGIDELNYNTTPVQTLILSNVSAVTAGNAHSLALKKDGTVWAWGDNYLGQLGDGTNTNKNKPIQVSGLTEVCAIASGDEYNLALKNDGTVWTWGDKIDNEFEASNIPVQVTGLTNITAIAAGSRYCLALKADGTVWAWGENDAGQLGNGSYADRYTPVQVLNLSGICAIAARENHSLALKDDGSIWAWGDNFGGQLGIGSNTSTNVPVQVEAISDVSSISAGYYYSLVLKDNGTIWAWGENEKGQIGDGTNVDRTIPTQVKNLNELVSVSAGYYHSLAVKNDGTVWAWGKNDKGQLGNGSNSDSNVAVQVSNLKNMSVVAAGKSHSLAIKEDGTVRAWGNNEYGQLGNGISSYYYTPKQAFLPQEIPTTIYFNSESYAAPIPKIGSRDKQVTVSATVLNAEGNPMKSAQVVYTLAEDYIGVSIDSITGVVTITPDAIEGTVVIEATYESLTATSNLLLTEWIPTAIIFDADKYSSLIPEEDEEDIEVTIYAVVLDEKDNPMEDAPIVYGLAEDYEGISIDTVTGIITITPQAKPGKVIITATYDTLNESVTLVLTSGLLNNELTISATAGRHYDLTVIANRIETFNGMEVILTYDADVFVLDDLCSFTKPKELGKGVIQEMDITVTEVSAGEVRFKVDKDIPNNSEWSGIVNAMRFKAIATREATVSITD